MLGRSKAVVLSSGARRRKGVPRWLVLLLLGVLLGAAGVLIVQQRYLPPRLSAAESAQLKADFAQADTERNTLQQQLADTRKRLDAALADKQQLSAQLNDARHATERLHGSVASLVDALPPDPRGGAVQVRAARFKAEGGQLQYDVVLSRERGGTPRKAVMQVMVAGAGKGGVDTSVKLEPVALTLGGFETLSGSLGLPAGFAPRQATVHVLDRPGGKLLGMRVLNIS